MKYKPWFVLVVCIALLLTYGSTSSALFNSDVTKAKEFMAAGMYPQAIELLDKRINDKPTDAEAHFQMGICFINTGKYGQADKRFGSAVRLRPDYGYKIGEQYKKIGTADLKKGRLRQALGLFRKAVEYQPNLKKTIAEKCYQKGKSYLDNYRSDAADDLFSLSRSYDPSMTGKINNAETIYGNKLLHIAKGKPKKERKKYIDEASKYLDRKTIDELFPPPSWQTIHTSTHIGKGFDDKDSSQYHIETVEHGKNFVYGDKIVVETDGDFKIWNGRWERHENRYEIICKSKKGGGFFYVEGPKDKEITVKIERFISSY